jgi:DNA polymerase III subunit epsilon
VRQIALDTETTGLMTEHGHRIVEIGCIELMHRQMTGNNFHCYIDPEREVDPGALAKHGLTNKFLLDKPKFSEVAESLLGYIKDAELIIHNAPFDVGFLNYELGLIGKFGQLQDYCRIFDTLAFARQKHPGQRNSLDALCKRYSIDNSHRNLHGALLDAELLVKVFLAMTGGQRNLFSEPQLAQVAAQESAAQLFERQQPLPIIEASAEELRDHNDFLELLKKASGSSLWEEPVQEQN